MQREREVEIESAPTQLRLDALLPASGRQPIDATISASESQEPYIDGSSLATRMQMEPLTLGRGLQVLTEVGLALAYVHAQGVVHRDIKPGNILLNREEKPFLADFGLALRDEVVETARTRVGTPAYMSPEQARGESHLVDGRSDIFSMGVVLYQLLTGKLPFAGRDRESLVYSLLHQEPRPPRQLSAAIPRELESKRGRCTVHPGLSLATRITSFRW
jgi:serine/threonine protein kinase